MNGESWEDIVSDWGQPLIKFVPSGTFTDTQRLYDDIPDECAVFDISQKQSSSVIIFSKYKNKWYCNHGERWVVRELLIKNGVLMIGDK